MERALRVGGPSLGASSRIPGARRCSVYAHDIRKVEYSLTKKDVKSCSMPPSERPSVRYDYGQLFGFDPDTWWSHFTSDV